MLINKHTELEDAVSVRIEKRSGKRILDRIGAYARGEVVSYRVTVSRRMGVSAVVMRIAPDGEESFDLPFAYAERRGDDDVYELELDTARLCASAASGLFFYEYIFLRGFDTLFSSTENNVDFTLGEETDSKFRLLVYSDDYSVPSWFAGGTMYHVFLDRFFRGEGEATLRAGASLDPDWEGGVPQYAAKPGMPVKNNVYFGGNLWGVIEKLDYLQSLGVTVLYLSPIFSAATNHRYDTVSYEEIDSLLGGRAAFDSLVSAAHARGIRIILDGVFNHTGDDSVYFNRLGNYDSVGAYQSKDSPYAEWYNFRHFPDDYEAWWDIEIMPRLQHKNEACRRYFTGKGGIATRWIDAGIDGWRLDVADELCDEFLDEFREAVKSASHGEGIIIGEVWENAVDKISYGKRREYFRGGQLDSVMNYPFRNATLALLLDGDANTFYDILTELWGTYPTFVCHALMNLLGTHDTERFLTRLGGEPLADESDNALAAKTRLSRRARSRALRLMRIASVLQYTVFGVPSLYYGDEAGLEGHHDPFCRMPYPWGRENKSLLAHYRRLGRMRREHPALRDGDFRFLSHDAHSVVYLRECENDRVMVAVNMGDAPLTLAPSAMAGASRAGKWINVESGRACGAQTEIAPGGYALLTTRG